MFEAPASPYLVPFDGSFRVSEASTTPQTEGHRHAGEHRRTATRNLNKLQRVLAAEIAARRNVDGDRLRAVQQSIVDRINIKDDRILLGGNRDGGGDWSTYPCSFQGALGLRLVIAEGIQGRAVVQEAGLRRDGDQTARRREEDRLA